MNNADAKITIINNTGDDLSMFDNAIIAAVKAGGVLPEELADLLTLAPVAGYPGRWRVDWA
jgi:hypothetical protein